jgi:hypothetical protein
MGDKKRLCALESVIQRVKKHEGRKDFLVWAINKTIHMTREIAQAVIFDVTLTVRSLPPCFVRLGISSWKT